MNQPPYIFGSFDLHGNVLIQDPKGRPTLQKQTEGKPIRHSINSTDFYDTTTDRYATVDIMPILIQEAFSEYPGQPENQWKNMLSDIRTTWRFTGSDVAKMLGVSKQAVLIMEREGIVPNDIDQERLALLQEINDFLIKTVSKETAIKDLLRIEFPDLEMTSPKNYLLRNDTDSFRILLGILKRTYA